MVSAAPPASCRSPPCPSPSGTLPREMLGDRHLAFRVWRRCKGVCITPTPTPTPSYRLWPGCGVRFRRLGKGRGAEWDSSLAKGNPLEIPSSSTKRLCPNPPEGGHAILRPVSAGEGDPLGCPRRQPPPHPVPGTDRTHAWHQKVEGVRLLGPASPLPPTVCASLPPTGSLHRDSAPRFRARSGVRSREAGRPLSSRSPVARTGRDSCR